VSEVTTHAQLYDLLQTYFGIGDFDDLHEDVPYYKARMNEIGKLKRYLTSRRIDVATMVQAAEYAHTHHVPIIATWQLEEVIPTARQAARGPQGRPLSERLQEAAQEAVAAGETDWAIRLSASTSVDALAAWEAHRG